MKATNINKANTPQIPGANMPDMSKMMKIMSYFLSFMMASFVYSTPSAVGIYIITTTIVSL
jgi:membrane protein insertase Oxa1/YidC/SpoIIIJ